MAAKEVSERETVPPLLRHSEAEMNMMGTRPLGRLLEERVHEVERAEGEMCVTELGQRCAVAFWRLERPDRHLDVDHRLRREPRHGSGPDVLDTTRQITQRSLEAYRFRRKHHGPSRVVWGADDHRGRGERTRNV